MRADDTTRDDGERLSADDMATLREQQFLDRALQLQRQRAAVAPAHTPGRCSNCGQATHGAAVYCDPDCKADHEARQAARVRQGRAR